MKDKRAARVAARSSTPPRRTRRERGHSLATDRQWQEERLRKTLGRAARLARMRSGLTQADVAESIGTVTEVYGRMERGKLLPSVPTLLRLCVALHSGPHELMGFVPMGPTDKERPWEELQGSAGPPKTPELQRLVRRLGHLDRSEIRLLLALVSSLAARRVKK
ncbi:helix-turn-helix transcriptional regulator [Hyalangium gracile]|uniref:helix-turn-helix transcriptional regulator n=1 Tax=Hyalangium gracile TaxID=394092 RepID=UPI001CCDE20D|nr:helix-turn-helix transcriptional regulator [Hyalangium gracile]